MMLSGNPGVTHELIGKVTEMLDAVPFEESRHIRSFNSRSMPVIQGEDKPKILKSNLSIELEDTRQQHEIERKAKEKESALREGLKLRNILQSSRMNNCAINILTSDKLQLTINRKMGYSKLIQDADRWHILSAQQQCWVNE